LVFEPKLIARVVNYLCERRLQGETLEQCSKKMGIAQGRLKGWLYRRAPVRILAKVTAHSGAK